MVEADKGEFAKIMAGAAEVFDRDLSRAKLAIYFAELQHFPVEMIAGAVHRHIIDPERGSYFPRPADIVRQITGNEEDHALNAWGRAIEAIRSHGTGSLIDWGDNSTEYAVMVMGGQRAAGMWTDKELDFKRRAFVAHYTAHLRDKARGVKDVEYISRTENRRSAGSHDNAGTVPTRIGEGAGGRAVHSLGGGGS